MLGAAAKAAVPHPTEPPSRCQRTQAMRQPRLLHGPAESLTRALLIALSKVLPLLLSYHMQVTQRRTTQRKKPHISCSSATGGQESLWSPAKDLGLSLGLKLNWT